MNTADGLVRSLAVETARASDLVGIQWLLDLESLPTADLTPTRLPAVASGEGWSAR
jgi:hypothetical protein